MAWSIEAQRNGRWRWAIVLTAYGAAVGEADTEEEAERQLAAAQCELLATEYPSGAARPKPSPTP